MARISNTTAYPNITPQLTDYIIGTDVSNNNNTNTITLQSIGQKLSRKRKGSKAFGRAQEHRETAWESIL